MVVVGREVTVGCVCNSGSAGLVFRDMGNRSRLGIMKGLERSLSESLMLVSGGDCGGCVLGFALVWAVDVSAASVSGSWL